MKPPYEAMLERLRRAGIPEEIIQALMHHDRFGQDLTSDQNAVEGLIKCYRAGQIDLDPDGALRLTERARKSAGRDELRSVRGRLREGRHAIKIRPELARRMNALFPSRYRITDNVLQVSDEVLATIRKHMQPGETESDVINRAWLLLDRREPRDAGATGPGDVKRTGSWRRDTGVHPSYLPQEPDLECGNCASKRSPVFGSSTV